MPFGNTVRIDGKLFADAACTEEHAHLHVGECPPPPTPMYALRKGADACYSDGDVPSVRFVGAVLRTLHARPLLVLAFARPEVREAFPRLWEERAVQELRLGDLSRRAGARFVCEMLGDAASAETVDRLVAQAEGNAFYLEELLRAELEGRGASVPQTVLAMVQARVERLDPDARRVWCRRASSASTPTRGACCAPAASSARYFGEAASRRCSAAPSGPEASRGAWPSSSRTR